MPKRIADTHDFSTSSRGHNIDIRAVDLEGRKLDVVGWSEVLLHVDDYVLLKSHTLHPGGDGKTRYVVTAINHRPDPPDMFFAELRFAGRTQEGS